MKIAIVGSRSIQYVNLQSYLTNCDEIVSGGARGVDQCAANYAKQNNIKLTEFLPNYKLYGRAAPIYRNREIVDYADEIILFWDGKSRGTLSVIQYAEKTNKTYHLVLCNSSDS